MDEALVLTRYADFTHLRDVREAYRAIHDAVRTRKLDLGSRSYALPLLMGVIEAICCGAPAITAVEMGVAAGRGLLSLCKAAAFFRDRLDMDIRVVGFDNGSGLPPPKDYRDHPELWASGIYKMPDPEELRAKLPDFAELHIGDIADTAEVLHKILASHPLAFMAVDVDFYSSAKSCLTTLVWEAECYLPAVPMYFDDLELFITNSDWSGEGLAIAEFNAEMTLRKLQRHRESSIPRFYTAQVLDHPIRTGATRPRFPMTWGII